MNQKVDENGQVIITGIKKNPEGVDTDEAELLGVLNGTARLFKKSQINEVKYDGNKAWLRVDKKDGNTIDPSTGQPKVRRYFVQMTELVTPDHPIISTINYTLVSGSVTVQMALANNAHTNGSTIRYQVKADTDTDFGEWITGNSVSLVSGFSDNKDNADAVYKVNVKAIKNGEESDEYEYTITIKPKVNTPTVNAPQYTADGNYGMTCTVTLKKSATKDAVSQYSTNGGGVWNAWPEKPASDTPIKYSIDAGANWLNYPATAEEIAAIPSTAYIMTAKSNGDIMITVAANGYVYQVAANQFQVKATKTGHTDSAFAKSSAITLNKRKAYYGFSTKAALTSEADIKLLDYVENVDKLQGQKTGITPTGNSDGYIWLCCVSAIPYASILPHNVQGEVPMGFNAAINIAGWKCYRMTNTVSPADGKVDVYIPN